MAPISSFGLFSRLPYELREQIWLEFLPAGEDSILGELCRDPKTSFEILRASRALYNEISTCLYSNVYLQFDLSPIYFNDPLVWTTFYLNKINRRRKEMTESKAMWRLENGTDARDRGFYNLRVHPRIEAIEFNLFAPDPRDPSQLFWLWRKVTRLVKLLKEAGPSLPHLTIRLQKCETQDWHSPVGINSSIDDPHDKKYDHDVVVLPFLGLQNISSVKIETHSGELKTMMDWSVIDWARGVISGRNMQNHPRLSTDTASSDQVTTSSMRELDRRVEGNRFWIHQALFSTCDGATACFMRRIWLSNWFVHGTNGHYSEFEEQMLHIINTYPDVIHQYDPDLKTLSLSLMHRAMVIMYHHAIYM